MLHLISLIKTVTTMIIVFETLKTGLTSSCDNVDCLSSLTQSNCLKGVLVTNEEFGCCPRCDSSGQPIGKACKEDKDCAVGLQCKEKICGYNKTSCHHLAHINPDPPLFWKPECYTSGLYKEKQCRGDKVSGRCFCFSETGQKIFGWDWRFNEDKMTCACSRHRAKLEATGHISTLHCQQNGNYEELQCDSGVCFCTEPRTGQLKAGTKVLPDTLWKKLSCYNSTLHGDTYLRQCESMPIVQKKVNKLFELHGTKNAAIEITNCNFDGSYGTYKLQGNEVKCIWRNGNVIDPYSGNLANVSLIDCACAIDQQIYEEKDLPFKLICSSNGNYQEVQHQNGKYYCVDAFGYAVSDFKTEELTKAICDSHRYDKIKLN